MSGAEAIIKSLSVNGVNTVFGLHGLAFVAVHNQVVFLVFKTTEFKIDIGQFTFHFHDKHLRNKINDSHDWRRSHHKITFG